MSHKKSKFSTNWQNIDFKKMTIEEIITMQEDIQYSRGSFHSGLFSMIRSRTSLSFMLSFSTLYLTNLISFGLLSPLLCCLFWPFFFLFCTWFYIRYTGNFKTIGEFIDIMMDKTVIISSFNSYFQIILLNIYFKRFIKHGQIFFQNIFNLPANVF